jgi:hypothetical protein
MRSFALRGLSWTTSFLFFVSDMAYGGALDLHAIATLANYERATSDPRFRHYRLREMSDARGEFRTIRLNWLPGELDGGGAVPVRGFAFEKAPRPESEMDLPSNLLCASPSEEVARMSEKELDTIYWEVRGHDGCYAVRQSLSVPAGAMALKQAFAVDCAHPASLRPLRPHAGPAHPHGRWRRFHYGDLKPRHPRVLPPTSAPSHGRSLPCAGEHDIHHRRLRFNAALRLGFWPPWSRERRGGARHGLNAVRRARAREGRRNVHAWLTRRLLRHGRAGGGRAQASFRTPPGRRRSRRAVAARHLASACGTAR